MGSAQNDTIYENQLTVLSVQIKYQEHSDINYPIARSSTILGGWCFIAPKRNMISWHLNSWYMLFRLYFHQLCNAPHYIVIKNCLIFARDSNYIISIFVSNKFQSIYFFLLLWQVTFSHQIKYVILYESCISDYYERKIKYKRTKFEKRVE